MTILAKPQIALRFRAVQSASILWALCLAGTLAGCGGGGSGTNTGNDNLPSVPSLPAISSVSPAQAVTTISTKTDLPVSSVTTTPVDSNIASGEIAGVVDEFTNPANIVLPQITSTDGRQGTFVSGTGVGLTQADLASYYAQTYPLEKVIQAGDSLQKITLKLDGGQTLTTLAIVSPTGTIRYCPALSLIPGSSSYANSLSTQRVISSNGANALTVETNRNPFTGAVFYAIPQQVKATLDSSGAISNVQLVPLQPTLGPGVTIDSQSAPLVTSETVNSSDSDLKSAQTAPSTTATATSALHQTRAITYTITYTVVIRVGNVVIARIPVTITTTIRVPIPHTGGG